MNKRHIFKKIQLAIGVLHLADKCLLVFMIILMLQSIHNLFFYESTFQSSDTLDVIVRTTAAAIFGYFISANFQNGSRNITKSEKANISDNEFDNHSEAPIKSDDISDSRGNCPKCRNRLQIIVVASIGVFSLVLLLIARNFIAVNDSSVATVSQLRDFVSGSVGFLIGHSTHQKNESSNQ